MPEDYTKCPLCGDAWLQHRDDWNHMHPGCGAMLTSAEISRSQELRAALSRGQIAVQRGQHALAAHIYADVARLTEEYAFWHPHCEASCAEFRRRSEEYRAANPPPTMEEALAKMGHVQNAEKPDA